MNLVDLLGLLLYFAILIVIGYRSAKKVSNSSDFAVAGNKIIWPILFATLAASFLGGGASMGRAGKTFEEGYVFMFAASAFPIATVLAGLFIAPRLKRYIGAQTVGDIMAYHFGASARLFTGIFSLIFCVGILGAQALAVGTVFHMILGIEVSTGILIGMAVVLIYSTLGGMWAVIQTDVVQFLMLAIFLPLTMLIGVHDLGGPAALVERLPEAHFSLMGDYSIGMFISIFVAFLLGETLVPPYTQRALSAPDSRHAKIGYSLAGGFGFLFYFVSATIGLVALVLYPNISPDQAMPALIRDALPVGLTGLVLASLLAVVMSTADSYLNSAAVIFVSDIYKPFIEPEVSEKRRLWIERLVNLVIGVGAVIFALYATSIVDALLLSYSLWAPTILLPFVFAVLLNLRCARSAIAAMLGGALITTLWKWGPLDMQGMTGLTALIAGVISNVVVFTLVYRFFRQPPIDSAASQIRPDASTPTQ
ncbi:sodium:solute symporter family protein [Halomonas sp. PAMB 3264]|uniref:sodium:solute symporter family protein n=1 Tax=unclassified Halomonas TaxID=2609666 RepID=UPI002897EBE2|nr:MULTISPECIES: sodium:solute symporter family protein [unclassified Halomonas]WNL38097.1 sodium:solute symporter family protein [Halomonas sp. PAMB 3232]WNL41423.1 sodium:solute symporter family protein [Halomonas sp. PAMB 3264]